MKIKPCPFCGSNDVKYFDGRGQAKWNKWLKYGKVGRSPVLCCSCGIGFSLGIFMNGFSDEEAKNMTIDSWNRRVRTHTRKK